MSSRATATGLFTLPGLGHAPHWERPEEIAARFTAFASGVEEPSLAHTVFG